MTTKFNSAFGKYHVVHRHEKGLSVVLDTLETVSFENWLFRELIDHGFQRIVFIVPQEGKGITSILTFDEVSYYSFQYLNKFEDIYSNVEKEFSREMKYRKTDSKVERWKVETTLEKLKDELAYDASRAEEIKDKKPILSSRVGDIIKNTVNQVQTHPPMLGKWYSNASGSLEGSEFLNSKLDEEIKYILFESKIKSAIVFDTEIFEFIGSKFKFEDLNQAMRSWNTLHNSPKTIHSESVFIFVVDSKNDSIKVQKGLTDTHFGYVSNLPSLNAKCISHQPQFDIGTVKKFLLREVIRGRFSNESTSSIIDLKSIDTIARNIVNKKDGKNKSYPDLASLIRFYNQEDESLMDLIFNCTVSQDNPDPVASLQALNSLIGLKEAKDAIFSVIKAARVDPINIQRTYLFVGNPGTGKTEVARLFAKILYEEGLIEEDKFVEVSAADITGPYQGDPLTKTLEKCKSALNGLLFFDEIYTISESDNPNAQSVGKQIISTINKFIEDHRKEIFVIFAGYEQKMPQLMKMNAGFESRMTKKVYFRNYTLDELTEICKLMINENEYKCDSTYIEKFREVISENANFKKKSERWGNARQVRTIVMNSIQEFNSTMGDNPPEMIKERLLTAEHIPDNKRDRSVNELQKAVDKIMNMTGLSDVKRQIDTILNNIRFLPDESKNLPRTLLFLGNPGTGKTEVARLLKDILYHSGVIQYDKLVEVSKKDLTGNFQGDTTKKPEEKCDEALGGILFLDEIYSLDDGNSLNREGQEIITTIMKYISDNYEEMFVIFAGYKEETERLLGQNSGMKSRVNRVVKFENYSAEELFEIAIKHLKSENDALVLTEGFKQALREKIERMVDAGRGDKLFGNAREIISLTKEILSNRANRYQRLASNGIEITEKIKKTLVEEDVDELFR